VADKFVGVGMAMPIVVGIRARWCPLVHELNQRCRFPRHPRLDISPVSELEMEHLERRFSMNG